MAKYINLESIDKDFSYKLFRKYPSSYSPGILAAIKEIKRLPVTDARENAHGYWIAEDHRYNHWHCSNCKYVAGVFRVDCNFCPRCGSDMRGEKDG